MKRIIAIILVTLVLASCSNFNKVLEVRFSVADNRQVNVQGLPGNPPIPPQGLTTSIPPIAVETKSEEYIREHNTSSELVTFVTLGEIKLEMKEPSSQTFDIVDSLWMFVSAPGLPEIKAAHYFGVPKNQRVLTMETSKENLKDYFLKDSMYFRLQGHFYNAPDSATIFTISSRFDVTANPLAKE